MSTLIPPISQVFYEKNMKVAKRFEIKVQPIVRRKKEKKLYLMIR